MIVRVVGHGQYRIDSSLLQQLNAIDNQITEKFESINEEEFREKLKEMVDLILSGAEKVDDEEIVESDIIIDPEISLEEAREIFKGEGAFPG
jgi:DNA-binding protein YbaB